MVVLVVVVVAVGIIWGPIAVNHSAIKNNGSGFSIYHVSFYVVLCISVVILIVNN